MWEFQVRNRFKKRRANSTFCKDCDFGSAVDERFSSRCPLKTSSDAFLQYGYRSDPGQYKIDSTSKQPYISYPRYEKRNFPSFHTLGTTTQTFRKRYFFVFELHFSYLQNCFRTLTCTFRTLKTFFVLLVIFFIRSKKFTINLLLFLQKQNLYNLFNI